MNKFLVFTGLIAVCFTSVPLKEEKEEATIFGYNHKIDTRLPNNMFPKFARFKIFEIQGFLQNI
jgi:hypothetical protein